MSEMTNKQAINLLMHIGNQIGTYCDPEDEEVYLDAISKAIDGLKEKIIDLPLYTMDYIKMSDIRKLMGLKSYNFISLDDESQENIYFRCDEYRVAEIEKEIEYEDDYSVCWKNELRLVNVLKELGIKDGICVMMDD